jgi:hypothetical protein
VLLLGAVGPVRAPSSALAALGLGGLSTPSSLLRATRVRESVAVENTGDCECVDSCDQRDSSRGTWCFVDTAECVGSNGFPAQCDGGACWAACSVVYGFDQCEDDPCMNDAFCIDGDGEYECQCLDGYRGDRCEEQIDGCADPRNACHADAVCEDLPPPAGPGKDGRTCSCNEGYVGDGESCVDADACAPADADPYPGFPCQRGFAVCEDLPPPAGLSREGRVCTCEAGYGGPTGDECAPLDACASTKCDPNAACTDMPAPFPDDASGRLCECNAGYEGDGETCVDVDACAAHPCPLDATCVDAPAPADASPGSRECVCKTGFGFDGDGCVETDACLDHPCGAHAVCTDLFAPAPNSPSGRECACEPGYERDDVRGDVCVDIDACRRGEASGSDASGSTDGPCSPHAVCTDLPAPADALGFACECGKGFYGDGRYCAPIDACNVPAAIELRTARVGGGGGAEGRSGADPAPGSEPPFSGSRSVLDAVSRAEQSEGYGTVHVDDVTMLRNSLLFGAFTDVGYDIALRFTTSEETSLEFRFGVDFGRGGFVMVDGTVKAEGFEDLRWSGDDSDAGFLADDGAGVFNVGLGTSVSGYAFLPGNHEIRVVGVDDCCDEGMTFQFRVAGGPWMPVSAQNLQALGSAPCHANARCVDQAAPALFEGYQCVCNEGYEGDGAACDDIDACEESPCHENADCADFAAPADGSEAGRMCTCRTGFFHREITTENGRGHECVETNACETTPCDTNAMCTDLGPPHEGGADGRVCECLPGFDGDGAVNGGCRPIDACKDYPCHLMAQCTDLPPPAANSATGRACACNEGFRGDGEFCEDANACDITPCDLNALCDDLDPPAGEDEAGRVCVCKKGFVGDGETCLDVDACLDYPCQANARCGDLPAPAENDAAGRQCTCLPGFDDVPPTDRDGNLLDGPHTCEPIDACEAFACRSPHAACRDLPPPAPNAREGRACACNEGYVGDGDVCSEIDACAVAPCDNNASCDDLPPPAGGLEDGRSCVCNSGYRGDGEIGNCAQIDACLSSPCHAGADCLDGEAPENEDGYQCVCRKGWRGDGFDCRDVDACVSAPCSAAAVCKDLPAPAPSGPAGRTCACNEGYVGDGETCEDAPGCADMQCDTNATCADALPPDTEASCACNEGFVGDGVTCRDADDCEVWYDTKIDVQGGSDACALVCAKSLQTGMSSKCVAAESGGERVDCGYIPPSGKLSCFCLDVGSARGERSLLGDITRCMHGTCHDEGLNAFRCACDAGWTGRLCDQQMTDDDCDATTCSFGDCRDVGDDYVCECQAGYSGRDCDVPPTHWVPLGANAFGSGVGGGAGRADGKTAGAGVYVAPAGYKLVKDDATYVVQQGGPSKLCKALGGGCVAHPASGPTSTGPYSGPSHRERSVVGNPSIGPLYEVSLFVSDEPGAGTKNPVYMLLHGRKGGVTRAMRLFPDGVDRASRNVIGVYALDVGEVARRKALKPFVFLSRCRRLRVVVRRRRRISEPGPGLLLLPHILIVMFCRLRPSHSIADRTYR